jgi:hypothetical protein
MEVVFAAWQLTIVDRRFRAPTAAHPGQAERVPPGVNSGDR